MFIHLKKYVLVLVLAFTCFDTATAIQSSGPLIIRGTNDHIDQLKEIKKGKNILVYTVSGFVNIETAHDFPFLYYRTYFKENKKGQIPTFEHNVNEAATLNSGAQIFLDLNKEYCVEVLDKNTDTITNIYIIKRLKVLPAVELTLADKEHRKLAPITSLNNYTGKITISAGETLHIGHKKHPYFENLEVEYTLINLKTKKIERKISSRDFGQVKLTDNTPYQLSFNYVLQPENTGNYYIEVRPYWYKSMYTYTAILIVAAVICILAVTYNFKRKIKISKRAQQNLEQAAIRLQSLLNPHFTFNALSTIQGLINTNRIEEANHYLEEFSSLLRKTLSKSHHIYNNLDQELEMMRMYLNLEALRFNFLWEIIIDKDIKPADIEIPTLLLQPIIENAIKHGLSRLGERGKLLISCTKKKRNGTFTISINDNGNWVAQTISKGYGLSLTEQRISTINQLKDGQTIELTYNKQEGTTAILTFKNWIN